MSDKDIVSINKSDLIASASKSLVGAIPFAGPLLTELVDSFIPNQRVDRLTKYVVKLEERLSHLEEESLRLKLQDDGYVALIESGYIYASRAISDDRRAYIASIVVHGLSNESVELNASMYLLDMLSELNDSEVIWLRFYLKPQIGGDKEFREKHSNVLKSETAFLNSPESVHDKSALRESYREHIERLGLIKNHYRLDHDTSMPIFDQFTGKQEVTGRTITHLGRMLLRHIDLLDEGS